MRDEASVASHTEGIADSEISMLASSQRSDEDITDDDVKMQGVELEDAKMVEAAAQPASQTWTTTIHPEQIWRQLPLACVADRWGYGRSPAFWYTLNFAYNHCYDLHRFHKAVVAAQERTSKTWTQNRLTIQQKLVISVVLGREQCRFGCRNTRFARGAASTLCYATGCFLHSRGAFLVLA